MFILSLVLKRLMKLRTFSVLNRVRVSKPQRLTQILVQYPPPPFTPPPGSLQLKNRCIDLLPKSPK